MDCLFQMQSTCTFCKGKNELCRWRKRNKHGSEKGSNYLLDLNLLPEDLLLKMFANLDSRELMVTRLVSRKWCRVAESKQLWSSLNMSCKRMQLDDWIFRLPSAIRDLVKVLNLMWTFLTVPAFNGVKSSFRNAEVLLMQHCKFAIPFSDDLPSKQPLPTGLRILDVRNVNGRWFDDIGAKKEMAHIVGMAFSQTMPSDWLFQLSQTALPALQVLHIQNNPSLSDEFLSRIIKNAPSLRAINVHGCTYVNGDFIKDAVTYLPQLTSLDVNGTKLGGVKLREVDWSCSRINHLNISFCCKISEEDLKIVFPQLKHLEMLQASFCGWGRALTDEALASIWRKKQKTSLECLDIQSTFGLTAKSLGKLCSLSPCLRHLRVGTLMKDDNDLLLVLENARNLTSFSIQMGDSKFTAAFLFNAISKHCNKLETLFLYNFSFDSSSESSLQASLLNLLKSCPSLRNFFTGGYPMKQRERIEEIVDHTAKSLFRHMNYRRAVQVIPQPKFSFDRLLCETVSKRNYYSASLKRSLETAINCQVFYKSGIQKLDDYHFLFLRNS